MEFNNVQANEESLSSISNINEALQVQHKVR